MFCYTSCSPLTIFLNLKINIMKKVNLIILALLIATISIAQKGEKPKNSPIELQAALDEIRKVTDEIVDSGEIEGEFDVTVKFNNVITDESEFELKILILTFKKSKSKSVENSFTFKYKFSTEKISASVPFNFTQNLAKALKSSIVAYQRTDSGNLNKNGFSTAISFTISRSRSMGGSIAIIEPITIGGKKGRSRKNVHTITIDYTPKK